MKLNTAVLKNMSVGDTVIITETRGGVVKGQGDVTYLFSRLRPRRFKTKRLVLLDPESLSAIKVVAITRMNDATMERRQCK